MAAGKLVLQKRRKTKHAPRRPNGAMRANPNIDRSTFSWITGPYSRKTSGILKLRYAEHFAMPVNGVVNTPEIQVYRANSLNDPNQTGGGHNPMGYNQLAQVFTKFTVLSSRIKVTMSNDVDENIMFGINQYTQSGLALNQIELAENKRGQQVMLAHGGYATTKSLSSQFNVKKFFGLKKRSNIVGDDEYSGRFDGASVPQQNGFFYLWTSPRDSLGPYNLDVSVEIEYTAIATDPVAISDS